MLKRLIPATLLVLLIAGFALAQDPTPAPAEPTAIPQPTATPDPLPICPALEREPDDVRTSYYMGEGTAYAQVGQTFDAIFSYTCIIRVIDPDYIPAYMARAVAHTRQRDYDRGIADYTRAIALDPSLAAAHTNRGILYTAIGEFDEAAADLDRAVALDAANYSAINNRAILYAIQSDFESAIRLLEGVITGSGIGDVLTAYRDPARPRDARPIPFNAEAAEAYALLGVMYSAKSLAEFDKYILLTRTNGIFTDQRIVGAAGALESRFTFEMRLDDGTWMSFAGIGQ